MELEGFFRVVCIHCTQAHRVKQAIFKFQVKGYFRLDHGRAAVSCPGISHAKACSNAGTQMGYREMPIQPEVQAAGSLGGRPSHGRRRAQRDRRLQSVIRSQVNWQEHTLNVHRHKKIRVLISGIWLLYLKSAAGMHAKSMQKITGSNLVCTFFEPLIK